MQRIFQEFWRFVCLGSAIAATLGTMLSFFAPSYWIFALLEHPRPQYVLLLLPVIISAEGIRRRWHLLWLIPLLINLAIIDPALPFTRLNLHAADNNAQTLNVLHLNLDRDHSHPARAIAYLNAQDADFLFLQEVTPTWLAKLKTQLQDYELIQANPLENSHGSAIWRRHHLSPEIQIEQVKTHHFPPYSPRPILSLHLRWRDRPLTFLSLHTTRPRNAGTSHFQQIEFDVIAHWLAEQPGAIVLGDFNATPWSSTVRQFIRTAHLHRHRLSPFTQGTWPAALPPLLQIPIDLCLCAPSLTFQTYRVGSAIGSDHRPLECAIEFVPRS